MTAAATQPSALHGRAIMVVEDEFFQAEELAHALTDAGARPVGPFPSLDTAMLALDDRDIAVDAAVLDINLHGEGVWRLAEALIARRIPFLFATGYYQDMLPAAYRDRIVCEKPYRIESLLAAISGLCAQPS